MKIYKITNISKRLKILVGTAALAAVGEVYAANELITNVSYDPTREFYQEFNTAFAKYWKDKTGNTLSVQQSHGGSGKQARAVIDGLDADVVTLALAGDIDAIAEKSKLIPADWQKRLPDNSSPYTSTIIFVVRKGNPKGIKSWDDLAKPDVSVITPNPKTSGGARWNYLAAWGFELKKELGDLGKVKSAPDSEEVKKAQAKARIFVESIFKNVPVLDSGARGSTVTFAQRGIGDVLLAWENEAFLVLKEFGADKFETVSPSISILAEPPVTIVDKVVGKRGTRKVSEEYLKYLYSPEGQEIAAKNFYRPRLAEVAAKYADKFPKIELFTIDDVFGGWKKAQSEHFDDKGVFDQIYKPVK
ncbi:MAG: sulfate ABC transporter substrate-binding protein [Victivallales bacterium]